MPPNAAPPTPALTESLLASAGADNGNPKVLHEATTGVLFEQDAETIDGGLVKDIEKLKKAEKRKLKLVWRNIIAFGYLHMAALYGAWLMITSAKWQTIAFGKFFIILICTSKWITKINILLISENFFRNLLRIVNKWFHTFS